MSSTVSSFQRCTHVVFTLLVIGLLLWAQSAGAIPLPAPRNAPNESSTNTIAYQGRLADTSGTPITAFVNMAFRIYNVPTGGSPLWEEFWQGGNDVQVSDGLFNVMLGSLVPIPPSVVAGNNSLWLGIAAGNDDEMTPRVQLGSVPFAARAAHVSSLNAADGDPTNVVYVDNDGRVGIGTSNPQAKLDVNGDMRFRALPTPYHMQNLPGGGVNNPNCYITSVYGLVHKFTWDPGGGTGNGTIVHVESTLAYGHDYKYGDVGSTAVGPQPIRVCVSGFASYAGLVDSIDIYYIPLTGYE